MILFRKYQLKISDASQCKISYNDTRALWLVVQVLLWCYDGFKHNAKWLSNTQTMEFKIGYLD